ncbi:family 10 glycosylhydrolase, partial [Clostridium sp.]
MKKILTGLLGIFLVFAVMNTTAFADTKEMRGAWISTVWNLDWPTVGARNNVAQQKQEFITLLDKLQAAGLNSVIVQVRPKGDALYNSSLNPWSDVLTGTQGNNPGYDPLAFMIEETHKRGMEFHAWFNPYRV